MVTDLMNKVLLAGVGALSLTRQKAEELVEELAKEGKVAEKKKPDFVKDLLDRAEKSRHDLEDMVSRSVSSALTKLSIATKEDLKRIEKKIDKL